MDHGQWRLGRRATRGSEIEIVARLAVVVSFGAAIVFVTVTQGGPIFDDPYILFRYADHLGTGQGWNFNPTRSSENAVTSVLYVLLLAALRIYGLDVVSASTFIFFVTTFSAAAFTGLTLERSGRRIGGVFAALLIASSPMLSSFRGMESSLFLCLMAAALFLATTRRSPIVTGVVLGLLVLARPDGLVFGVVMVSVFFLLDRVRRLERREWLRLFCGASLPLLGFGLISLTTFGSPLPSTLAAKIAQADSGFWRPYLQGGWETIVSLHDSGTGVVQILLLVLVVAALGGVVATAIQGWAWQIVVTLIVATVGLVSFYSVMGIPAYPWYYALPIYSLLVLASIGFDSVLRGLSQWRVMRIALTTTLASVLVFTSLLLVVDSPTQDRIDFTEIGGWLHDNTDPSSSVAAMEIGKIGWFSEREMVDYLGLLDSDANDAVARGDFIWWASHYQPDYWVTRGDFVDRPFFNSRCFQTSFSPVFRAQSLTVYRRIQSIPSPAEC